MNRSESGERLGAHVSTQGGVQTAPARGREIGASAIQIFTKTPNQWREPVLTDEARDAFLDARSAAGIDSIVAHDSYLINLASPDEALNARSVESFIAELKRSEALRLDGVVSHPGNYIDDRDAGLARNADGYTRCLEAVPGAVRILVETTAGTGTALGSTFEELAELRERVGSHVRHRIGFCADTCHLYAAGHDLVGDYDGVWERFERTVGLEHLGCLHLNDSKTPFASRRDRHELIGEGSLGTAPFERIMNDPRFRDMPKILETPKGDDLVTADRRMLALLRGLVAGAAR
jgi:deoxyribonuclease-4